jgi:hypothetical protein
MYGDGRAGRAVDLSITAKIISKSDYESVSVRQYRSHSPPRLSHSNNTSHISHKLITPSTKLFCRRTTAVSLQFRIHGNPQDLKMILLEDTPSCENNRADLSVPKYEMIFLIVWSNTSSPAAYQHFGLIKNVSIRKTKKQKLLPCSLWT